MSALSKDFSLIELERLIAPGALGFCSHFEVTEVIAMLDGQNSVINVFTIVVAEERSGESDQDSEFLNKKRICLKNLKNWSFGVVRYVRPIDGLIPALRNLSFTNTWQSSGKSLQTGKICPLSPQFVPPDAIEPIPLNKLLKNNFWNGSHVFEWSDRQKDKLQPLFQDPQRLQELSLAVQEYVPLSLASVSDRLGNLIVQVPVTVMMSRFAQAVDSTDFLVELAWHPKATSRSLRANCHMEFDGAIAGYMTSIIEEPVTRLQMASGRGLHRGVIWDEQYQVILAATAPSSFINSISFRMNLIEPEPRIFSVKKNDGTIKPYRITLSNHGTQNLVGETEGDDNGGWTRKRMYTDEVVRLTQERRFLQYGASTATKPDAREEALKDLRQLINQYGQEGAWLWDPYLTAYDILETLFHCKHSWSDLRALTSIGKAKTSISDEADFIGTQRNVFENAQSNWQGLKLEYRAKWGVAGWAFHDRFLIFPNRDNGALAWSLGTSVNSFGVQHHILQRVDNGQLVMDAFLSLWNQLDHSKYLIWKNP